MSEYAVSVEDAISRLNVVEDYDAGDGPEPCVHTFRDAPFGLIGAHWSLGALLPLMERHGVEESGESATAMKHGLVVIDDRGPLFLETKDAA